MDKPVIVIAGGSRGIGRFLIDSFLTNYDISACAREIVELDGRGLITVRCDLSKQADVRQFVAATFAKFGRIDAVIYNAGLFPYDNMLDVKESDIDALYGVVVKGYLFLCQEIIPVMRKQKNGHIINIGSIRGLTVTPNKMAYSAMKRAAMSITESIQIENAQYGIKTTSINPGTVDTESSHERYGQLLDTLDLVQKQDILNAITFLLSLSEHAMVNSILIDGQL